MNPWTENSCARCYPGPTPSLWLEGLRQGVQDYKRLWLLKKEGVPTKQLDGLADRALKFVEHTSVRMNTDQVAPVRQELDRMLVEKAGAAK